MEVKCTDNQSEADTAIRLSALPGSSRLLHNVAEEAPATENTNVWRGGAGRGRGVKRRRRSAGCSTVSMCRVFVYTLRPRYSLLARCPLVMLVEKQQCDYMPGSAALSLAPAPPCGGVHVLLVAN